MSNKTPVIIAGTVTSVPSGTQDVRITAQTITLAISAAALPLPAGAATETTLAAVKTDLDKFQFDTFGNLKVNVELETPETIAVTQSTSPWVISGTVTADAGTGNFTVVQSTGSNLHIVLDSGTLTSITDALPTGSNVIGHVITDLGSVAAVTQTTSPWVISGTVTANQGTTPWATQDAADGSVAPGTAASKSLLIGGIYNITPPIVTNGQQVALQVGTSGSLYTEPALLSPGTDLFRRQRVSSPIALFSTQYLTDKLPLLWDEATTGSVTSVFNSNTSSVDMTVSNASGDRVIRQTKQYFVYEPGRAQAGAFTMLFGAAKANCVQSVGIMDDNDGIFLRLNGTTFEAVIRSSVSGTPNDSPTTQANFNIDKLNGSGPSGMTLDLTKTQLFFIEYQWFGVGTVRFGVFYNGNIFYFHQVNHANIASSVYMKQGNLPARYEIHNIGTTSGATTFSQICCVVQSEAGYAPTGVQRAITNGTTGTSVAGTGAAPLISIRLKAANKSGTIIPTDFDIMTSSANNFRYEIILNGTLTGASFTSVAADSYAEYDVSATALTGGTVIAAGYVSSAVRQENLSSFASILKLVSSISGTTDILTIYVTNITNGITYFASWEWQEFA